MGTKGSVWWLLVWLPWMVNHQCRQCCKHRYKAKPWKWISCPQSAHSGKSCLSRPDTKMGLEIYWPRLKGPMVTDHVNQNLRTLLSPIWDDFLCLACVYVGKCICLCVQVCLHVYMHMCVFRDQTVVPQAPSIFFLDMRISHWPGTPQAQPASQWAP